MFHAEVLDRFDPLNFQPANHFTPWLDETLASMRWMLNLEDVSSVDIRATANQIEPYLATIAGEVLASPKVIRRFLELRPHKDNPAPLLAAKTVSQLRDVLSDLQLLEFGRRYLDNAPSYPTVHGADRQCSIFAAFAIAKIATATDLLEGFWSDRAMAQREMMEGYAAASMYVKDATVIDRSKREAGTVFTLMNDMAEHELEEKQHLLSQNGTRLALRKGKLRRGDADVLALKLANSQRYPSRIAAARRVKEILETEHRIYFEVSTIDEWLRTANWQRQPAH